MKFNAFWIVLPLIALGVGACNATPAEPTDTPTPQADIRFNLTVYSSRKAPALERLTGVTWEGSYTWSPFVVYRDGTFYMFYNGYSGVTRGVGLAYSKDGKQFTRYEDNPVLELGEEGYEVMSPVVYVQPDGTWVMYAIRQQLHTELADRELLRFTAPAPEGPWEISNGGEPVYAAPLGHWTDKIVVRSILLLDGRIWLAFDARHGDTVSIGIMESSDGLDFHLLSDEPLLTQGAEGEFDQNGVGAPILFATPNGFEMFFLGLYKQAGTRFFTWKDSSLWFGYAESPDGLHWTKYDRNPVLQIPNEVGFAYASGLKLDDTYWIYYVYGSGSDGIGAASLTINDLR